MADGVSDEDLEILENAGMSVPDGDGAPPAETEQQSEAQEAAPETEAPEATDPPQEGESEQESDDGRQKTVPHGALHSEREARKVAQAETAELRAKYNLLDSRIAALTEAPETHEVPDVEEDPFGYLKHLGSTVQEQQAAMQQRAQVEQEVTRLQAYTAPRVQEFAQQQPDFHDADVFVENVIRSGALVVGGNPDAELRNFTTRVMQTAARNGTNPAEAVYQFALQSGYQPPAPQAEAKSAADNVSDLADKSSRHKSLSSAGGSAAPSKITTESLADMSDEEFSNLLKGGGFKKVDALISNAARG